MAVWSKALPLTANCPSPLPGLECWPGHVRKLPVTFPPPVTTGQLRTSRNMAENVTENQKSKI